MGARGPWQSGDVDADDLRQQAHPSKPNGAHRLPRDATGAITLVHASELRGNLAEQRPRAAHTGGLTVEAHGHHEIIELGPPLHAAVVPSLSARRCAEALGGPSAE